MGHKRIKKLSMHNQIYERLRGMYCPGQSKKEAMKDGTYYKKIFSSSTLTNYLQDCYRFERYVIAMHPEVKNLYEAKKYYREFLDYKNGDVNNRGEPLAADTIHTYAKALGKLYRINPESKEYYVPPIRKRENIKKNRTVSKRTEIHFSEERHPEFVYLCLSTGLRRVELGRLKAEQIKTLNDLWSMKKQIESKPKDALTKDDIRRKQALDDVFEYFTDCQFFIEVINAKGGKRRFAPILGPHQKEVVAMIRMLPKEAHVCKQVFKAAPIHRYRAKYAEMILDMKSRPIEEIPYDTPVKGLNAMKQGDVYVCRGSRKGVKLDKRAMKIASKALGHNRVSVVATSYIYSVG